MKSFIGKSLLIPATLALVTQFSLSELSAQTSEADGQTIRIDKTNSYSSVIPIAISGFSGEVDKVLRFDLEVLGCQIVAGENASYLITGSNNGNVQGYLKDGKGKSSIFGKAYAGESLRAQAHSFAEDIIQALRGTKGIFHTKIAFKIDHGPTKEICIADYDGFNARQMTQDKSIVSAPCWWPGRNALFYNSYKDGYPGIFLHDLGAGTRVPIARYAGSNITPAASRDGKVAMILSKNGFPNLYVADSNGGNLRQLTKNKDGEACPCWSPDGQTICCVSGTGSGKALYLISAAGGSLRRLRTAGVFNATEPDWSPDGKTIVFTTQSGANSFEICTVPAEGGEVTRLCPGEDPSWAPNSRTVIFARRGGNGKVLSFLDVPTKRVKDGAQISGSASQPSWAR